jgi:hypothetical protein
MARLARPRLIALKAALAVGGFSGVLSVVALASAGGVIDQKQPGAIGEISGQTPAQGAQAQQAPITPSVEVAEYGWWEPGSGKPLSAAVNYPDANGQVGLLNAAGAITTKGHPFFEPIGENGRACVSCHQPANGMSLAVDTVQERWKATGGKDPIFAAVDGSNCPSLPQGTASSHSLLLNQGLFRIFLPFPPENADGSAMKPDFDIEVVSDPTGCNTDPVYGLHSKNPTISIFRRPRVVANMKYVTSGGGAPFNIKDGSPMVRDPETGQFVNMNIMADAREPTPKTQAVNAALTHLQAKTPPSQAQLKQILDFENQVYVAQAASAQAGNLTEAGGPSGLGPRAMEHNTPGLGDNFATPVFGYFDQWAKPKTHDDQAEFRASVARGMEIYFTRSFYIRDVTHLNTVGLGNPIRRTCATCHNAKMTGMDTAPGWMDLGTGNLPWSNNLASTANLPTFKVTCHSDKIHPYLGRVIYTHDPGRALISGRCVDIGAITMQQFRGLSARAPYFSNGSAKDLAALIDYYDKRFEARYTDQEKHDLVNFLSVL